MKAVHDPDGPEYHQGIWLDEAVASFHLGI